MYRCYLLRHAATPTGRSGAAAMHVTRDCLQPVPQNTLQLMDSQPDMYWLIAAFAVERHLC
jgi:hypothetical protein